MGLITNSLLVGAAVYVSNRRAMKLKKIKAASYSKFSSQEKETPEDREYFLWPPPSQEYEEYSNE